MGGSKRLAELLVQGAQARYPGTPYRTVRFGNVLGSNGSVVPIFQQQLSEGKPLTVTHPEVTRYFMTIPEAVQLVLQASLLPEAAGRIAMLEMGRPVKILDLAQKMIQLSGTDPKRAAIIFTGLTAGEKLHEELVAPDETPELTAHPKVMLVGSSGAGVTALDAVTGKLEAMASGRFSDDDAATWLWDLLGQLGVALGAQHGAGHEAEVLSAS
jgi:FlaA1/EpsC-like NDP-sugar epimerase